jgi:hypothetical protein
MAKYSESLPVSLFGVAAGVRTIWYADNFFTIYTDKMVMVLHLGVNFEHGAGMQGYLIDESEPC